MIVERDKASRLQPADYAIAGAVSGVVTRAVVSPLDLLKIRFQLQVVAVRNCVI